jgi:hypothetical protein
MNYGFREAYFESCNFSRENTNIDISVFMVDLRIIMYVKTFKGDLSICYLDVNLIDTEYISLPSQNMKFVGERAKRTSHKLHILSSRLILMKMGDFDVCNKKKPNEYHN